MGECMPAPRHNRIPAVLTALLCALLAGGCGSPAGGGGEAAAPLLHVDEDTPHHGTLADFHARSGDLLYAIEKDGKLGTARVLDVSTGAFSYTPKPDVNGLDVFSFVTSADGVLSPPVPVQVLIRAVNDPPLAEPLTGETDEDTPLSAALAASDVEGDPLTFAVVTPPAHGRLALADPATGAFVYTPDADFYGADAFEYAASDGRAWSLPAPFTIGVRPVADEGPKALDAAFSTAEDTPLDGQVRGYDPDGVYAVVYRLVTNGALGTAVFATASGGGFRYTPSPDANGTDRFTYRVETVHLGQVVAVSDPATVTVTILPAPDAPRAEDSAIDLPEDVPYTGALRGWDPDGEPVAFTVADPPALGTVTVNDPDRGTFTYTPAPDASGADAFVFQAANSGGAARATVSVTVVPVNDAPRPADVSVRTWSGVSVRGRVAAPDPEGDPVTFSLAAGGALGEAAVTDPQTGAFTYAPASGVTGSDRFTVAARDPAGASATATVTVTIDPLPTTAPRAHGGYLSTRAGAAVAGVLTATDPDGDPLTFEIVTPPALGTVAVNDPVTGAFTYTALPGTGGLDTFTFVARDPWVPSEPAAVAVEVRPFPDPADAPSALEQTVITLQDRPGSGVLAAWDPDGRPLTFSLATPAGRGQVVLTDALKGAFTYTPNPGATGYDAFTFSAANGLFASDPATVTVFVQPAVNGIPQALDATLYTARNTPVSGTLGASDPDGGPGLTFAIADPPATGTLTLDDPVTGAFTYAPAPDALGTDRFTFQADDGSTLSLPATVTVHVARAPRVEALTVGPDFPKGNFGNSISDDGGTVALERYTPYQGIWVMDRLTGVLQPAPLLPSGWYSFLSLRGDGLQVMFSSDDATLAPNDVNGAQDVFLHDLASGTTTPLSVNLLGVPANGASTSFHDAVSDDGRYAVFDSVASDLVAGDTNGARDLFLRDLQTGETRRIAENARQGRLSGDGRYVYFESADGSATYRYDVPAGTTAPYDAVRHVSSDGRWVLTTTSTAGGRTLRLRDDPAGTTQNVAVAPDGSVFDLPSLGSVSYDGRFVYFTAWEVPDPVSNPYQGSWQCFLRDVPGGETVRIPTYPDGSPTQGHCNIRRITTDGRLLFFVSTAPGLAPGDTNQNWDLFLARNPLVPNGVPVVAPADLATDEDAPVSGVLAASDPDGDPITFRVVAQGTRGTAAVTDPRAGAFTYTPRPDAHGTDAFTVAAGDGWGESAPVPVTVTIRPVNDPPAAAPQTLAAVAGRAVHGILAGSDADGDALTFAVASPPALGAVSVDPATGALTYTPGAGASGTDAFTFTVDDGAAVSAPAAVAVTVRPGNTAPQAAGLSLTTPAGTAVSGLLPARDADGDPLTFEMVTTPALGTLDLDPATGAFAYTPAAAGEDAFSFSAADPWAASAPATVRVTVNPPANAAPAATDTAILAVPGTPYSGRLPGADPDGDPLVFVIVQEPAQGTLTLDDAATGAFTYAPAAGAAGADAFAFTVGDGTATAGPATVAVSFP